MRKLNAQRSELIGNVGSLVGIGAFVCWLLYTETVWHPVAVCVAVCLLGCVFIAASRRSKKIGLQKNGALLFLSLLFSCFAVIDKRVVHTGKFTATIEQAYLQPVGKTEIAMVLLLTVFVFFFVRSMFVLLFDGGRHKMVKQLESLLEKLCMKHFQVIAFAVLVVCWSVCWLTFFPGTGAKDTLAIQSSPLSSSAQHTLTYNYIMYGLMSLGKLLGGSWFWGVALYTLVQLVFCAWTVSYVLNWMNKRNVPNFLVICILLFFAFSRIVPNIAIQSIKDTFFSFGLLLFIPLLFDCSETQGKSLLKRGNLLLFVGATALTILIRNNGIFVMAGVAVFVMIVCRKHWKPVVALCLVAVILPYATDRVLMATVVKREKIAVESLGIPLQQMAAVVAKDGEMTEEEASVMETIMPSEELKARYRPTSTDSLKWGEGAQYLNKTWISENKNVFLKTWASMLVKNLDIYVEAYLLETLSYWNVGEPSKAQGLYYTYPQSSSVSLLVEQHRVLPEALHNTLQQYYRINESTESPSGGTLIWLTLFLMMYLICTGQKRKTLCYLPVVFVWGTVMISAPIAYGFRYLFSLYLACPFLVAIAITPWQKQNDCVAESN